MRTSCETGSRSLSPALRTARGHAVSVIGLILGLVTRSGSGAEALKSKLDATPFRIAYESYVSNNWEIFVCDANGSHAVNLTQTPGAHEHYPQVSPDATKIAFTQDDGEGRTAVRSLWVMDIDGKNRRKHADHAREQFWRPDSKRIGFLPQEYPKFKVMDYYTKGMNFYELATGKVEPHVNSSKLHHLYNPGFAPNGKWIVSTVHAGMGVGHAILLIEANGDRIINLNIPGCRPCISPDGKQLAWGSSDHDIIAAPLDTDASDPKVGEWRVQVNDAKNHIYHVDWSPDSRFLSLSRGPEGHGDAAKAGTFQSACEIVGVYATGWDLFAISAEQAGKVDLSKPDDSKWTAITTDGNSNKESAWFRPRH